MRPAESQPIVLRRSTRAQRLTLKLDVTRQRIELIVPRRVSEAEALRFADRNAGWIATRRAALPVPVPFAPGSIVPVEGVPHRLEASGALRGRAEARDGRVLVPGDPGAFARRVKDWLKLRAGERFAGLAAEKAARIGRAAPAIRLTDARTRWGSCTPDGRIALSWRLILAPPAIADYVVAHEVAHLRHLDHGPGFWSLCRALTDGDAEAARRWLKRNGATLWRYGAEPEAP